VDHCSTWVAAATQTLIRTVGVNGWFCFSPSSDSRRRLLDAFFDPGDRKRRQPTRVGPCVCAQDVLATSLRMVTLSPKIFYRLGARSLPLMKMRPYSAGERVQREISATGKRAAGRDSRITCSAGLEPSACASIALSAATSVLS